MADSDTRVGPFSVQRSVATTSTANARIINVQFRDETPAEIYMQASNEAADRAAHNFDAGLFGLAQLYAEIADRWAALAETDL